MINWNLLDKISCKDFPQFVITKDGILHPGTEGHLVTLYNIYSIEYYKMTPIQQENRIPPKDIKINDFILIKNNICGDIIINPFLYITGALQAITLDESNAICNMNITDMQINTLKLLKNKDYFINNYNIEISYDFELSRKISNIKTKDQYKLIKDKLKQQAELKFNILKEKLLPEFQNLNLYK